MQGKKPREHPARPGWYNQSGDSTIQGFQGSDDVDYVRHVSQSLLRDMVFGGISPDLMTSQGILLRLSIQTDRPVFVVIIHLTSRFPLESAAWLLTRKAFYPTRLAMAGWQYEAFPMSYNELVAFIQPSRQDDPLLFDTLAELLNSLQMEYYAATGARTVLGLSDRATLVHRTSSTIQALHSMILDGQKQGGSNSIFILNEENGRKTMLDSATHPSKTRICIIAEQAERFIESNLDKNLTLGHVAAALNLSQAYLSRAYSRHRGKTLVQFLAETRIARIQHLLESTDMKLTAIAQSVGLGTSSYMIEVFRNHTGQTPGEYREQNTGSELHV